MQAVNHQKIFEYSLIEGMQRIAAMTEKVYGGEHMLVYKTEYGKSAVAENFVDALKNGKYEDDAAEDVRSVLAELNWPDDGSKTAILLAASVLDNLRNANLDEAEVLSAIHDVIAFAIKKVECMAREGNGKLPGGGLWLLTLVRPLVHFAEEENCVSARLLAQAASVPMKALAENAGKAFHEVFERVRAVSPNQFYSLHQIGLKSSHIPIHDDHMDVIQYGLEIRSGKMKNLMEMGITVEEETAKKVLEQTKTVILALGRSRSVWL